LNVFFNNHSEIAQFHHVHCKDLVCENLDFLLLKLWQFLLEINSLSIRINYHKLLQNFQFNLQKNRNIDLRLMLTPWRFYHW
jgi:hypothetical protein